MFKFGSSQKKKKESLSFLIIYVVNDLKTLFWRKLDCRTEGWGGGRTLKGDPDHQVGGLGDWIILLVTILANASLVAQMVKDLPAMWETGVQSLGLEDSLEERIATYLRIPWAEESLWL